MKQDRSSATSINFDALDLQISGNAPARMPGTDDPLAELARIVGNEDLAAVSSGHSAAPASGPSVPSFDDFLKMPSSPGLGGGEGHGSLVDQMVVAGQADYALRSAGHSDVIPSDQAMDDFFDAPATVQDAAAPTSYDQALAELGLRYDLPTEAFPAKATIEDQETGVANVAHAQSFGSYDLPTLPPVVDSMAISSARRPADGFDDMLAEFEAAMREAGAEKAAAPPPSLAQIIDPPLAEPQGSADSSGFGAAAAAGAAGAVAAGAATARSQRPRRGLVLAAGVVGVAVIGVASLMAFGTGSKSGSNRDAPVIAAKPGATKERPENPGGVEVSNQDKQVLQPRATETPLAERVVPREEQPLDLTQAQRTAEAQSPNGVRQIPGVSLVVPPQTGGAPAQAVPRPVASVPITIAGQPPATALLPAVGPPSLVVPPEASGASPSPPRAAFPSLATTQPTVPPATAPPVAAPQLPPSSASAPPSSGEPRRVRAVPIRPDEGAPSRAQAQPRVVPVAPRSATDSVAAEADNANGPLRITPQASRGIPARVAAVLPPSAVPTSTAAQPVTTQTAPVAPATSGSGFSVQLAAEGSEDAARSKFNRMRSQHSDVLGSMSPVIRNAEVNGRSIYRLRVGNMSRDEAVGLCERLKADGGSCFVARN